MNAWFDCMTSIDAPEDGMTKNAPLNGVLVLHLKGMKMLRERCPEIGEAIEKCTTFVNYRIEKDEPPVLMLSYT